MTQIILYTAEALILISALIHFFKPHKKILYNTLGYSGIIIIIIVAILEMYHII